MASRGRFSHGYVSPEASLSEHQSYAAWIRERTIRQANAGNNEALEIVASWKAPGASQYAQHDRANQALREDMRNRDVFAPIDHVAPPPPKSKSRRRRASKPAIDAYENAANPDFIADEKEARRVLDQSADPLPSNVIALAKRIAANPPTIQGREFSNARDAALALYDEALKLDDDHATMARAESLYNEALRIDPTLSIAHTNIGNIYFRKSDWKRAERCWATAIALDPNAVEPVYNTGYMHGERGAISVALEWFTRATKIDPSFADAHFNLANVAQDLGHVLLARLEWNRYLRLEPSGEWSNIARERLARTQGAA